MATDLFLRDLNLELQRQEEETIRESKNKDLIEALDKGEDIVVGILVDMDEYIPVDDLK